MKEYIIEFGNKIETIQLDHEGSFMVNESVIQKFEPTINQQRFEIRTRVRDQKEELTEFLRFRDETKDMWNVEFQIERSKAGEKNGYYYVIKKYTIKHNDTQS